MDFGCRGLLDAYSLMGSSAQGVPWDILGSVRARSKATAARRFDVVGTHAGERVASKCLVGSWGAVVMGMDADETQQLALGAESLTFIAAEQASPDAAEGEDTAGEDAHTRTTLPKRITGGWRTRWPSARFPARFPARLLGEWGRDDADAEDGAAASATAVAPLARVHDSAIARALPARLRRRASARRARGMTHPRRRKLLVGLVTFLLLVAVLAPQLNGVFGAWLADEMRTVWGGRRRRRSSRGSLAWKIAFTGEHSITGGSSAPPWTTTPPPASTSAVPVILSPQVHEMPLPPITPLITPPLDGEGVWNTDGFRHPPRISHHSSRAPSCAPIPHAPTRWRRCCSSICATSRCMSSPARASLVAPLATTAQA